MHGHERHPVAGGDAPLAALFEAEVLHGIREVDALAGDARGCERAGPWSRGRTDKRLPVRSSRSPGCSPTSMTRAGELPSPNTVCVASRHSSHPRHDCAASASRSGCAPAGSHRPAPERSSGGHGRRLDERPPAFTGDGGGWKAASRPTMSSAQYPATPHALPRDLAAAAVDLFGRERVVAWCEELLAGRAADDDEDWPDIAWLGGTVGWIDYWARTWGPGVCCTSARPTGRRSCWRHWTIPPGGSGR